MTEAIGSVITYTGLSDLAHIDEKKWNYAIELLIKFLPDFIEKKPSTKSIYYRTRKLSFIRQRSWKEELIKQQECITRNCKSPVIQKGQDGTIADIGFGPSDWDLGPNGLDPYRNNPETICVRREERRLYSEAISKIPSVKKRHGSLYAEILSRILRGEKVGKRHAEVLGIRKEEVASRVFESKVLLKNLVADLCPVTGKRQRIYENQRTMKHELKRLTFSDLKRSYRDNGEISVALTIRDWRHPHSETEVCTKAGERPGFSEEVNEAA